MDRENSDGHVIDGTDSLFADQTDQESGTRDPVSSPKVSTGERFTIGEVVSSLQGEFPSLSVSKVRYLERRRLLELERTSGGYRLFTDNDIELLRRILSLQENEYLPLEVIKQRIDSGIIHSPYTQKDDDHQKVWADHKELDKYTKDELCEALGADQVFIGELISVGVIGRRSEGNNGILDSRDVEIARIAIEMSKYSIQPRHLRGIVAAVEREVAMFKQVLNPDLRSGDSQRVSEAIDNARHLAAVDARLKELIMADSIESLDVR